MTYIFLRPVAPEAGADVKVFHVYFASSALASGDRAVDKDSVSIKTKAITPLNTFCLFILFLYNIFSSQFVFVIYE